MCYYLLITTTAVIVLHSTSAYVYGTQEEPRGKQCVTRVHTVPTYMASTTQGWCQGASVSLHAIAPSMCRRRHVRICTCMGDASPTPRDTWSRHTRMPYVRVNYIPKRNGHIYIYTYDSSDSTPLLHDSLPRFPLGNYSCHITACKYPVVTIQ